MEGTRSDQKTSVKVVIYGDTYTMKGATDESHMRELAAYVDQKMSLLGGKFPNLPMSKIAVLSALNIADELTKLQEDYDNLIKLIEDEKSSK